MKTVSKLTSGAVVAIGLMCVSTNSLADRPDRWSCGLQLDGLSVPAPADPGRWNNGPWLDGLIEAVRLDLSKRIGGQGWNNGPALDGLK
jgi:hypothetical protein